MTNFSEQNVVCLEKSETQGERNAHPDAVSWLLYLPCCTFAHQGLPHSGLDNAGKTTIVKRIMNEDITSVSPTLGFIIKTIDFRGWHIHLLMTFQ